VLVALGGKLLDRKHAMSCRRGWCSWLSSMMNESKNTNPHRWGTKWQMKLQRFMLVRWRGNSRSRRRWQSRGERRGHEGHRAREREQQRKQSAREKRKKAREKALESLVILRLCRTATLALSPSPQQLHHTQPQPISISISISICIQLSAPVGWLVIPCIFNMQHTEHHERKASHRPRLRHTVCGSNERMNEWHGCGC